LLRSQRFHSLVCSGVCFCLITSGCLPPSLAAQSVPAPQAAQLDGYTPQSSATELALEAKYRDLPQTENLRSDMQHLSARPHAVGSPYDKENADWLLSKFQEWGFDTHIETFYVLFPTPKERKLELLEPQKFTAALSEPPIAVDPTSNQQAEQLPSYNAYSIDGDVTGPLVYVNYGRREDYDDLERMGVSVKGAIVIARYGETWRGIKPKVAAEHGAIGCIIYSDPQQDGYSDADSYPAGGGRPKESVQRGGVNDTNFAGDPLTPGIPATKDAKRLALKDSPIITKIPVLPISYGDAQPLLAAIGGKVVPEPWRGGLPITYHVGGGPAKVHLKMMSNWDIKPIYDVVAKIPGNQAADEWVIRGNHHDAWVNGAEDPISGLVAELAEARALGELRKQGWKPRRTIIYCAWDGEEPGLLGSTEWVEDHAAELRDHAVLYVNSDTNERGFLDADGAHSVEHFINDVARQVPDPETRLTVFERAHLHALATAKTADIRGVVRNRKDIGIGALGDGSDFAPFLDYLAIPSLDLGFSGEDAGSVYHSIYDDFYYYTHFVDTDFRYGRALAQTAGTAVLRMADAELLPYQYTAVAETIAGYVKELKTQHSTTQETIKERNLELDEGVFAAISDPKQPSYPPKREPEPPYLNFAPLDNGVVSLTRAAKHYQEALTAAQAHGLALDDASLEAVNHLLLLVDRTNLREEGLPGRPWYKNQIYAPGAYTGYGVKTLAGVREAMDQHQWSIAEQESPIIGNVLEAESRAIDAAASRLEAAVASSAVTRTAPSATFR
jgi:N-acetylated-alpha-linked acidic dipeptidase